MWRLPALCLRPDRRYANVVVKPPSLLANCSLAVLARVGLARAFVMQKDTANIKATDATAERFIGAANERKMRYGQLLDLALDALDRAGEGR